MRFLCDFNKHTIKTYNTINIVQVSSYKNFVQFTFFSLFNKSDIFMWPIQHGTTIQNWY